MIYDTNDIFDFKKNVTFISPKSVSSGCYFIRCFGMNQNPLYIQPPKCKSKQGIVKTGKKMHCDLIFTHDDESFLRWIEEFENQCQQILFENRSKWFDTELEIYDIENSFSSSLKIYKSQHVLRTNIPLRLGKCALKIYDEQEQDVNIDTITNDHLLMSILEIQGIKCSSRNFQIDFEIKQIMVLNPVDLFEKCILSKSIKKNELIKDKEDEDNTDNENNEEKIKEEVDEDNTDENNEEKIKEADDNEDIKEETVEDIKEEAENEDIEYNEEENKTKNEEEVTNLGILNNKNENEMQETDFSIPPPDEIMHLKKRNDVYFEMYTSAKRKAKLARKYALSAYLEAKRIKNTYLIDEVFDDDDDDDDNIEEDEKIEDDSFMTLK
jgi:hypothetical protein